MDLWARAEGKPLWKLLVDMTPAQVVRCVDFRYLTDALTPAQAVELLERQVDGKAAREAEVRGDGHPAYTTSAGWLGYADDKIRRLCRQAIADGWTHLKVKVGRDVDDDIRRLRIIREEIGEQRHLMIDANQVWDVPQAIEWMAHLRQFRPLWIEEPTSPDDILGHAAIARALEGTGIGVATGEMGQNRVLFKQLLQARACISVAGTLDNTVTEYVDHLHEHFVAPCRVARGRYLAPLTPGYGAEMHAASLDTYEFPHGEAWR